MEGGREEVGRRGSEGAAERGWRGREEGRVDGRTDGQTKGLTAGQRRVSAVEERSGCHVVIGARLMSGAAKAVVVVGVVVECDV